MSSPFAIVVLISGQGSNLQAIIDACHLTDSPVNIEAVICNREDAPGLSRAIDAGIKTIVVPSQPGQDREAYDALLQQAIDQFQPKLVVLAGFMRILSESFVNHYKDRLINIHPSLLPQFRGLNTHQRALESGVQEHGATVHFVTYELDSGPLVVQARVPVNANDNVDSLSNRVLEMEHIIYPLVINWIARGRVTCQDNQVELDGNKLAEPLQYSVEPVGDAKA